MWDGVEWVSKRASVCARVWACACSLVRRDSEQCLLGQTRHVHVLLKTKKERAQQCENRWCIHFHLLSPSDTQHRFNIEPRLNISWCPVHCAELTGETHCDSILLIFYTLSFFLLSTELSEIVITESWILRNNSCILSTNYSMLYTVYWLPSTAWWLYRTTEQCCMGKLLQCSIVTCRCAVVLLQS